MSEFTTAYRPKTFGEVIGQAMACKTLESAIDEKRGRFFALTGPSGTGKTTLARIAADHAGCGRDVLDVDAATNSGIEKMRDVMEAMRYKAIGGSKTRAAIIDEAHGLSRQAWDSLLKTLEEPRAGVLWFACTTNIAKIPKTVLTRAITIKLNPVSEKDIERVVMKVVKAEDLKIGDGALDAVIAMAQGSPRQALSNLAVCADLDTRKEAMAAMEAVDEDAGVIDLCRFLTKPGSWRELTSLLEPLKEQNPEGVRIVVSNYFGKVCLGAKDEKGAKWALDVLEAFKEPYRDNEGIAPLMVSLGRVLYG